MRPRYETDADLRNEREAIDRVLVFGERAQKLKDPKAPADFVLAFGMQPHSVAEVKCRQNPMDAYPTLMISRSKVDRAVAYAKEKGVDFMLVVRWSDKIGVLKIDSPEALHQSIGGRVDRGDEMDIETVYHIPVKAFEVRWPRDTELLF